MLTAETIKKNIKDRLLEMVESRRELITHINFLSCLGVDVSVKSNALYFSKNLESVAKSYIKTLCKKLTAEHGTGTPAEIDIDPDLYCVITRQNVPWSFTSLFKEDNISCFEDEKLLIDRYLDAIDFETIASEINTQAAQLKEVGLNIYAKKIIAQFHLAYANSYYAPFQKNRRVFCHTSAVDFWQSDSRFNEMAVIQNALNVVERDSAISFAQAMPDYLSAIQSLSFQKEKIPSRSVFGKGGHLEIHCFKEKHEFRFSIEGFDAILAFLTINGEADTADNIMKRTGIMEAA